MLGQSSPGGSILRVVKSPRTPENKEQINEGLKITYLATNKAFFEDKDGKPFYLNTDNNTFEEADIMDTYPMNVQFDTVLPFDKNMPPFKTRDEAFVYVKMQIFKYHVKSGIEDFKHGLAVKHFSKEIIPDIERWIQDHEEVQALLDAADREKDPQKKDEIEQAAYDLYLQKEGSEDPHLKAA